MMDLKEIKELSSNSRYLECYLACKRTLKSEPENFQAWKYAGESLLRMKKFKKAKKFLYRAHKLDNEDLEIIIDIGDIFLSEKNILSANQWYSKAIEVNHNYAPAIFKLGMLKQFTGVYEEAINLFQKFITLKPKSTQAYIEVACCYLESGFLVDAELALNHALVLNKNTPRANQILGIVRQKQNKIGHAIKYFRDELKNNPECVDTLLRIGEIYLHQGDFLSAIASLEKTLVLQTSEKCSLLLGQAYHKLGRFAEAIAEYRKIEISKINNKLIPFYLGTCLLDAGKIDEAIEAFKIACKIDEKFVEAWGNIGTALINKHCYLEAIASTKKCLDLDPNNSIANFNLGGIYLNLSNFDQALIFTLKSLKINPNNSDAHANLGAIYIELGNLEKALASSTESINLNPENSVSYINLAVIYKDFGDLDKALKCAHKSLELNPNNPNAYLNIAGIYHDLGNYNQALSSTLKSLELKPENPKAIEYTLCNYDEERIPYIKDIAGKAIVDNKENLHSLTFVDAISSFGEEFIVSKLSKLNVLTMKPNG